MKIFYFSGTGNTFYTAKTIRKSFPGSSAESISDLIKNTEIPVHEETILILSPLYFYGIPHIVKIFIERLKFDSLAYLAFVITAEYPDGLASGMLNKIFSDKGVKINSIFYLTMPTNYLIKSKMLKPGEIENTLDRSDMKINKIIDVIKKKKNYIEKDSPVYSILVRAKKVYAEWEKIFYEFDSQFIVSEICSGCKLCEKHCPAGNIKFENKPVWNKKCEACFRCINICPEQAIQYGDNTCGKRRYFNPRIKLHELNHRSFM